MNPIGILDQISSLLTEFSPVLWKYKQNLVKQGFTEEEAFTLVRDYQNLLLHPKHSGD